MNTSTKNPWINGKAVTAYFSDWSKSNTWLNATGTSYIALGATNRTITTNITMDQVALDSFLKTVKLIPAPAPPPHTPPRAFNRYVNASDLMEEFIAFLGTEGVRRGEVMSLPLELWIKWLIIRACEEDKEDPGITLSLPPPRQQPRCAGCQRWMRRDVGLALCGPECANRYYARPRQAA